MNSFIFGRTGPNYFISFLLFSGYCLTTCSGANVLIFVGLGEGSHFLASAAIGKELALRGHNITAMISNAYGHRTKDASFSTLFNFEVFVHSRPVEEVYEQMEWVARAAASGNFLWKVIFDLPDQRYIEFSDCDAVFKNESVMERLVATDFDVVIADPLFCCGLLLAHHLHAKVVIASPLAWNADIGKLVGNPTNPSWIPSPGTGLPTRMTFLQRFLNILLSRVYGPSSFIVPILEEFKTKRGLVPGYSMVELYQRADLVLVQTDFSMEAAIPLMPNVVPVGGLTTRPADPLPEDLEAFIRSSGDAGIIVFSLGTYVTHLKAELIDVFADAFSRIPQKVIWQLRGTPPETVKKRRNILTMEWLPQNDLLGHSKTRAFVYQGGNNGLHEALYHGVPIIVIPFFGDQNDVAARVVARGVGISKDFTRTTAESLTMNLREIVENKRYKEAMMRQSAIYHDRPERPVERAAFWIEHVIKHGGDYMRSPINELAWYQYYLLDVIGFLIGILLLISLVAFYIFRCLFRMGKQAFSVKRKKH